MGKEVELEIAIQVVDFYKDKLTQNIMWKDDLNCKFRPKNRISIGEPLNIVENIFNVDYNVLTYPLISLIY